MNKHDLVYRDQVIDTLKKNMAYAIFDEEGNYTTRGLKLLENINLVPPAQAQQWIPCSERLPEENDDYWVTADPRYVPPNYKSTDLVSWYEGKWLMADYFVLDEEKRKMPTYKVMEVNIPIIAWMPLPKSYREKED